MIRTLAPLALLTPLIASGCAIVPDTPMVGGEAQAQGTAVALGESVWQGDTILTRCVHAGRLIVSTRITATHWKQTVPMTLGEPYTVMNRTYVLGEAMPAQVAGQTIPPGAYRFTYAAR